MTPLTGLALGRLAVGTAALARPDLLAAVPNPDGSRPANLITQAFGSREIALGILTLLAVRSGGGKAAAAIGMFVDGADATTALQAVRSGGTQTQAGYVLAAVAGGAVLAGATGLRTGR